VSNLPATRIPLKIYCEHSALSAELRALQRTGRIKLVGFPYDFPFSARAIASSAVVSDAQGRDLNTTWAELHGTWDVVKGSEHLKEILKIVGPANRRDALHLDSAYTTGCAAMIRSTKATSWPTSMSWKRSSRFESSIRKRTRRNSFTSSPMR